MDVTYINRFNDWPVELKSEANFLTDSMELRSNSIALTLAVGISVTIDSWTCFPAAIFLTPITTFAPRSARTRAVSRPIPLDPPDRWRTTQWNRRFQYWQMIWICTRWGSVWINVVHDSIFDISISIIHIKMDMEATYLQSYTFGIHQVALK